MKKNNKFVDLPLWDLRDFYINKDSKFLKNDLIKIEKKSNIFRKKYETKVKYLSSKRFYLAISELESISECIGKIMSYAQLLYFEDLENIKNKIFFQQIQEQIVKLSSLLIFFNLELNLIGKKNLLKLFNNKDLKKYKNWIEISRQYRSHQLEKNLEKLMSDKGITSSSAWIRLFDETISALQFPFKRKKLTSTEILNYMTDFDQSKRKESALSIGKTLKQHINIFTTITNTLAKDKSINDEWRKFQNPIQDRNLSNFIEDDVVECLSASVQKYYPRLSHRYYRLKSRWFRQKSLMYWDRNAPLPFQVKKTYYWEEARDIVLNAYNSFSPEMNRIAKKFFDNRWIDVPPRKGKQSGAFSASTVPSVHPYILLNYQGKLRDVMTLAHELGHGIHQYLASKKGYFNSSTPLTLSETASVFGEMLTFKLLLSEEKNLNNKRAILANKIEDMLNTVVRQIAFFEFEKELHKSRKISELSTEQICKIWMNTQKNSLGPFIKLEDNYKYFWSYIPHFIHSPFYVYAYAFGDCLVNSLYSIYQRSSEGFVNKYIVLLKAGGSKKYDELLKPFGLDLKNQQFWYNGLDIISNLIDELEELEK